MSKTPFQSRDLYLAKGPNLIINGAMDFWQRSTSSALGTNSGYFSVDRYLTRKGGGGGSSVSARLTDVPNSSFLYSHQMSNDAANNLYTAQRIESFNISSYIGKTVTFSAWIKPTGASFNIFIIAKTPTSLTPDVWGTDIINDDVDIQTTSYLGATALVTNVWQRISVSFLVPSSASRGLSILMGDSPPGSAHGFLTTGWMLTEGIDVPEHFYRAGNSIAQELMLCQRYYEKSYDVDVALATATNNGVEFGTTGSTTTARLPIQYKINKRITPTVTLYNPDTGTTGQMRVQTSNITATVVVSGTTKAGVVATGSFAVDNQTKQHWTADAEL